MDIDLYDPNTGFGLFGKPTFGTRFGQVRVREPYPYPYPYPYP